MSDRNSGARKTHSTKSHRLIAINLGPPPNQTPPDKPTMAEVKATLPSSVDAAGVTSATDATVTTPDASSGSTDKDKKLTGKQKKGKSGDKKSGEGKRGQLKAAKSAEKGTVKKRANEVELLKGISKPATRRLFKQIDVHEKLRLADNATAAIRATIGTTTQRVVHSLVRAVVEAGRQTAYLCDARAAVHKELPRSTVFAH